MERQSWPEKPLILGKSGTQYVAIVTKLLSWYCEAHLVESYCKESNISVTGRDIFLHQNLLRSIVSPITNYEKKTYLFYYM